MRCRVERYRSTAPRGGKRCSVGPLPVRCGGRLLGLALVALGVLGSGRPLAAADLPADALSRLRGRPSLTRDWLDRRGRLPVLVELPDGERAADHALLEVAPGIGARWLDPAGLERYRDRHPGLRPVVAPRRRPLLNKSGAWTGAPDFRAATGLDGTGVVVGIVDSGLDVRHPDFRNADGSTRVSWMLTGGPPLGRHPDVEEEFGCTGSAGASCAVWSAADIDEALTSSDPDDEPGDPTGHGTHVASIAAGNSGPMLETEHAYIGVAPGATLVVAAPPGGTDFSDPFILNAARFIFDRAELSGMQTVVNVSLGSDFGPHDGTSALEKGLSAMVGEAFPGRAIVVAAGNSGAIYDYLGETPFGIHTVAHASPHAVTRVPMTVPGWEGTVSGAVYVWLTFQPGDDVEVGLEGPGGEEWVSLTAVGEEQGYESDDGGTVAGVVNNTAGANAGITPDTNSAVVVVDGSWQADDELAVLLRGRGHAHLWVSGTGDLAPGLLSGGVLFRKATRAGTIGVPASAPSLIAVGCTINRVSWRPQGTLQTLTLTSFGGVADPAADSSCYFSGAGPTPSGALKPDVLAPGAYVAAAMSRAADPERYLGGLFNTGMCPDGMPACQKVDDWHAVSAGTSMSAPQAAGAVALLLQREPMLTQPAIAELLRTGAAHPTGSVPFDYQMGAGELDLMGTLQVLATGVPGSANPKASYYVLAAPTLRPDPSAKVELWVQLRRVDGSLAFDVPVSHLRVELSGADLVEPLELVDAGTFRAAIAAPAGSGGTVAELEVLVDGRSLGKRSVPIGVDEWAATSGVRAVGGGCAIGRDRPRSATPWPLQLLLVVPLLVRRSGSAGARRSARAPRALPSRRPCR